MANTLRIAPPMLVTESQIDEALAHLDVAFTEAARTSARGNNQPTHELRGPTGLERGPHSKTQRRSHGRDPPRRWTHRTRARGSQALTDSPLANPDLAPVPLPERKWTTYNFAALWISMAHCIPTYMLASGLIDSGMSWMQALFTILLGNVIVLVPILLNSHPGTRYGIPFPCCFVQATDRMVPTCLR